MKRILILSLLLNISLGIYIHFLHQKSNTAYKPDVSPPIHNQLQNPDTQTDNTKNAWLHEVIQRETQYNPKTGILKTRTFTSWTESIFTDEFIAPSSKWSVDVGPFVAVVDRQIYYGLGAGYTHYFSKFNLGGKTYIGNKFFMLTASAGYVMY